jgi:hypothetical protein
VDDQPMLACHLLALQVLGRRVRRAGRARRFPASSAGVYGL